MVGALALAERFAAWGAARHDVRALLVIGSAARTVEPVDRWSDLDVVLVTSEPSHYIERVEWLDDLGTPWLTLLAPTATGDRVERRVLFDDGQDVDIIVVGTSSFGQLLDDGLPDEAADVLSRGHRFLLDKDGFARRLVVPAAAPPPPPSQAAFSRVVDDFWYHAVWVTKKLMRGELWPALAGQAHMRQEALLPMLAWQAKARHGWGSETWHSGRFLERWADPEAVRAMPEAFARYDRTDVERALLALMGIFSRVAIEAAEPLGYPYPTEVERGISVWVRRTLGGP